MEGKKKFSKTIKSFVLEALKNKPFLSPINNRLTSLQNSSPHDRMDSFQEWKVLSIETEYSALVHAWMCYC